MSERGGLKRIEKEIRALVAQALMELNDPRLGLVTILTVKLSRDKKYARVHYSILDATGPELRKTDRALESARGHLQGILAKHLDIRHTPILNFVYDESIAEAFRMREVLDEISEELGKEPEDPAADYEVYDPEDLEEEEAEPNE